MFLNIKEINMNPKKVDKIVYNTDDQLSPLVEVVNLENFNNSLQNATNGNVWIDYSDNTYELRTNYSLNPGLQISACYYYLWGNKKLPSLMNDVFKVGSPVEYISDVQIKNLTRLLNGTALFFVTNVIIDPVQELVSIVYYKREDDAGMKTYSNYFIFSGSRGEYANSLRKAFDWADEFIEDGYEDIEIYASNDAEIITDDYTCIRECFNEYESYDDFINNCTKFENEYVTINNLKGYMKEWFDQ